MMRSFFNANLAVGILIGATLSLAATCGFMSPRPVYGERATDEDNEELLGLFKEDQGVRMDNKFDKLDASDFEKLQADDKTRRARVTEIYRGGQLMTGKDYYHAAMIFQHGDGPDDYLLAHEFSMAAIILGDSRGRWLAAASEDRLLMNLDRPQRFATQFRQEGKSPFRLYKVDAAVTDSLRHVFDVHPLADAIRHEEELNK